MFYKWGIILIYTFIIGSAAFGNHDTNLNMFLASIGLKSIHIISFTPTTPGISNTNSVMEWGNLGFKPNTGAFLAYAGIGSFLIHLLYEKVRKTSKHCFLRRVK